MRLASLTCLLIVAVQSFPVLPTAGLIGTAKAASRSPDELAQIAHDAMQNNGFYAPLKRELFAEDFVFRGPVVGPLCMADYAGTLEVFKVYKAFPDVKIDQSEWTQDPHDPLRYWGIMRVSGTHTGDLNLHDTVVKPTGKRMVVGPQANSITFDEHGKVKYLTSGYVTDYHDTEGQTGEYGLVFAILKSIGIPIPGRRVFKFTAWINSKRRNGVPKTTSHVDDLPEQWKSQGRNYGPRAAENWQ